MSTAIEREIQRLETQIEEDVYVPDDARVLHQLKMIRDSANAQAKDVDQREAFRQIVAQPWDGLFIHGTIANFNTIVSWLHPGESSISIGWFRGVITENPSLLATLSTTPTGRQIFVSDDAAINDLLKRRGFGQSEANRNLIKGACPGNSFYEAQLVDAVQSGRLLLAKATEQEKQAIAAERAAQVEEQHQRRLLNASPAELRQVIKNEAAERAIAARDEQDRQHMAAVTARDAQKGYEPLPTIWQGRALDAHFIKSAPAAVLRNLLKRYGSAQIDARLRGQ